MSKVDPIIRQAIELVEKCNSLQLATIDENGIPHASYAPFYRNLSGDYYIFVSTLSSHTSNFDNGLASILLIEDESSTDQIYARTRLGFSCACTSVDPSWAEFQKALDGLKTRHGNIILTLRQLSDFKLYRLSPHEGTFVLGFGKAYKISAAMDSIRHVKSG